MPNTTGQSPGLPQFLLSLFKIGEPITHKDAFDVRGMLEKLISRPCFSLVARR